jgi:threonine/homoserine efflux transporter RhtA
VAGPRSAHRKEADRPKLKDWIRARSTFALFLSIQPASAALIGILVLRQIPAPIEWAGILLVICGVALHKPSDAAPERSRV